jgi:flagellar motility protein MotE (MotC chaperone)
VKKLFNVIVLVLAMNFLAAAGGVGWLFKSGHLNKEKLTDLQKIVFPPSEPDQNNPTTQPDATTQPTMRLDELLARASGRPAGEQVDFIQHSFDSQAAQLDRRERELSDLQRQVDMAKQQMVRDRAKLEQDKKDLASRQDQETRLASDKGFQDSLQLYTAMAPKQAKTVMMSLSDDVLQQYLQAMDPRTASKIIKEFKMPDEVARIQKVLEKMRATNPTAAASG